jgi:hypothetical protein
MLVFTFTHDIYNYVPETSHVSKVHSAAAVQWLHYALHVVLFPTLSVTHCTAHQHFPQCVCSAQYGCFLQFLGVVLAQYVAQALYE